MDKVNALDGIRPSAGGIHLGHYVGDIQPVIFNQCVHNNFIMLGDLHLATSVTDPSVLRKNLHSDVLDMVADMIAAGIDPEKNTFYLQSSICVNSLSMLALFGSLVTVSRLERLPALKALIKQKKTNVNCSFLTFPLMQAVDILLLRAEIVYSNDDNKPFVEFTGEVARKFNNHYGHLFVQPKLVGGRVPFLVGVDGIKMSKARRNCVYLCDPPGALRKKVMTMFTDPERIHADIPGSTENNPVFVYHRLFNENKEEVVRLDDAYRGGHIGDVEVKERLFVALEAFLSPMREKALELREQREFLVEVLSTGNRKANDIAKETIEAFHDLTGLAGANIFSGF